LNVSLNALEFIGTSWVTHPEHLSLCDISSEIRSHEDGIRNTRPINAVSIHTAIKATTQQSRGACGSICRLGLLTVAQATPIIQHAFSNTCPERTLFHYSSRRSLSSAQEVKMLMQRSSEALTKSSWRVGLYKFIAALTFAHIRSFCRFHAEVSNRHT
jgi:hypothetical protein